MSFVDRHSAGRRLAAGLSRFAGRGDVTVFALPRGGVPVAAEVARALGAPLEPLIVRKVGAPGAPELALGTVATGGVFVANPDVLAGVPGGSESLARAIELARAELARRERLYAAAGGGRGVELRGRTVIVVDDGAATGSGMLAAVEALRARKPARIVAALPVASREAVTRVRAVADETVVLETPQPFYAVGEFYQDFSQVPDSQVLALLEAARERNLTQAGERS